MGRRKAVAEQQPETEEGDEAAPGVGHNSGDTVEKIDEEILRAQFVQRVVEIEGILEQIEELKDEMKGIYSIAKEQGHSKQDIGYALKLRAADDKVSTERRRQEAKIARWINHPIGTQADLFDEVDRTPAADRAEQEGYQAGLESKSALNPPYAAGTEQYDRYCTGWHNGQAVLARGITKTPIERAAEAGDPVGEAFDDAVEDAPEPRPEAPAQPPQSGIQPAPSDEAMNIPAYLKREQQAATA